MIGTQLDRLSLSVPVVLLQKLCRKAFSESNELSFAYSIFGHRSFSFLQLALFLSHLIISRFPSPLSLCRLPWEPRRFQ